MAQEYSDPKTKLILIADDDVGIRQFLEMAVRKEGFKVETSVDGPDTISKIKKSVPDLIILDLMMPGFGGFEILRQLQGSEASRTPIVIITARFMDESTQQMIRSEANVKDFVFKPISLPILYTLISRVLKTPPPEAPERFA